MKRKHTIIRTQYNKHTIFRGQVWDGDHVMWPFGTFLTRLHGVTSKKTVTFTSRTNMRIIFVRIS
jgi:hypothetical protein